MLELPGNLSDRVPFLQDSEPGEVETAQERPFVAIVGAGVAGLAAGRVLQDQGCLVTLFDKGRRAGGRLASRDRDGWAFDHGAQYFTARDERFRSLVDTWLELGVVAPWEGRVGTMEKGILQASPGSTERFVGVPEMNALAAHLAQDLDVRVGVRVDSVSRVESSWRIATDDGSYGPFDAVIVALPKPQAEALVGPSVPDAIMEPCWALMLGFDQSLEVEFDGVFVNGDSISWMARNSSKPARGARECWVVHASPAWSKEHLDSEPQEVVVALLDAFREAMGTLPTPQVAKAHLWRFARGGMRIQEEAWWDPSTRLAVAGDWLAGGRVEGAWQSGVAAAGFVLGEPETKGRALGVGRR
jgi:renalase